jgi:hypothetical protein
MKSCLFIKSLGKKTRYFTAYDFLIKPELIDSERWIRISQIEYETEKTKPIVVEIKFQKFDNTEYEQIISPLSIKGVIVSVGKFREALFIYRTGKFVDISDPQLKTLLSYNIVMADDSKINQAKKDTEIMSLIYDL